VGDALNFSMLVVTRVTTGRILWTPGCTQPSRPKANDTADCSQKILDAYLPRNSSIALSGIEMGEAQPTPGLSARRTGIPEVTPTENTTGFRKTNRKTGHVNGKCRNE
jgi:hypothetical protein